MQSGRDLWRSTGRGGTDLIQTTTTTLDLGKSSHPLSKSGPPTKFVYFPGMSTHLMVEFGLYVGGVAVAKYCCFSMII